MKAFKFGIVIMTLFGFLLSGCTKNLLSEFGAQNGDEALLYEAQQALNNAEYDTAISVISEMSSSGQAKSETREVLSHAYAGKCGLNFYDYITSLSDATSGGAFKLAAAPFVGVEVDPDSCLTSLQTLDLIGPSSSRTADQNTMAAIVGLALMGSATRLYTDNNGTGGDGSQDSAGISCTLTDDQVNKVILGYAYLSANFSYISGQTGGSTNAISDSIDICDDLAGSACLNTDPNAISSTVRDLMKDLLNTTTYGVGTVDGSDPLLIPAACI